MKELIEDIRNKKPIRIIYDGKDFGIYEYNATEQRYEGFGFLTIEAIKEILRGKIDFIKIRRTEDV